MAAKSGLQPLPVVARGLSKAVAPGRWWALVGAGRGRGGAAWFVLDAFIVNVAIPSIPADLRASTAEIEADIVAYQIAYATLVISGGCRSPAWSAR